jgi:hypothetical protein
MYTLCALRGALRFFIKLFLLTKKKNSYHKKCNAMKYTYTYIMNSNQYHHNSTLYGLEVLPSLKTHLDLAQFDSN